MSGKIILRDAFKTYTFDQDKTLTPEATVERFKARLKELDLDMDALRRRVLGQPVSERPVIAVGPGARGIFQHRLPEAGRLAQLLVDVDYQRQNMTGELPAQRGEHVAGDGRSRIVKRGRDIGVHVLWADELLFCDRIGLIHDTAYEDRQY